MHGSIWMLRDDPTLAKRPRLLLGSSVEQEREGVTQALRKLEISGPEARYDLEYSTAKELQELTGVECEFEGTHYCFSSPVLEEGFLILTTRRGQRILDVGAGNGTLLKKLVELGHDPHYLAGADISSKAVERIRETGAQAFLGTASNVTGEYDKVFLSYFVDRDSDQRGTFKRVAHHLLLPGGVVVLEGLFPCVMQDSKGVQYGPANVTKGRDATEDVGLVAAEFGRLGLTLLEITTGERFVYSLDGPEELPSFVLVFRKD